MSTLLRTARNLWRIGFKEYGHQMQVRFNPGYDVFVAIWLPRLFVDNILICVLALDNSILDPSIGDTKAGTLIATDRYGNKYYENMEELPLRTRWVDYTQKEFDASQIDVGWHAWLAYMVDKPPTQDAILQTGVRTWELTEHRPTMTLTRGAYKPYST
ncbi:hypothetical protein AJ78_04237 [Emergomyces pasteurianus Ep9510]|uniref:NADH dehydrogenase [ubiquinone] 1 alpha subcomplex subunit n=1 Tax=Emergomyces pasteurianus Ep9510 TaxID=1447872 RepID=A0A1J9PHW2_9EURO|nr:hypothetical protein AJ78_04237 [Emergomyces pasteurianus Ep9510]